MPAAVDDRAADPGTRRRRQPSRRSPSDAARFLNRELSWLDFNARVLALAEDAGVPLLERAKFLAIFSQNLDEFFQVRVAGLKDQVAAGLAATTPDGRTPAQQLLDDPRPGRRARRPARSASSSTRSCPRSPTPASCSRAGTSSTTTTASTSIEVFEQRIFPVLTPLAVDPGHPFPYISDLSLNLAVIVRDPVTGERRFARVKVPPLLPRFVVMPDGERFVPLEQVIAAHLDTLFPGMEIEEPLRRSGSPATPTSPSRRRRPTTCSPRSRSSCGAAASAGPCASRSTTDDDRRGARAARCASSTSTTTTSTGSTARSTSAACGRCTALDRPDLKDPPWVPVTQARLASRRRRAGRLLRACSASGDVLVHHPYDVVRHVGRGVHPPGRRPTPRCSPSS